MPFVSKLMVLAPTYRVRDSMLARAKLGTNEGSATQGSLA